MTSRATLVGVALCVTPCDPRPPGRITLRDLKQCGLAGEFFDAFFNVDKYLAREQREQAGTPQVGVVWGAGPGVWVVLQRAWSKPMG